MCSVNPEIERNYRRFCYTTLDSVVNLRGLIPIIFQGVIYAAHYHSRDAFLLLKLVFSFSASVCVGFAHYSKVSGAAVAVLPARTRHKDVLERVLKQGTA